MKKITKIRVKVENLDRDPDESHAVSKFTPRAPEPARTATYWRNCYEAEREVSGALRARWRESQEENEALRDEIESLRKPRPVKRIRKRQLP